MVIIFVLAIILAVIFSILTVLLLREYLKESSTKRQHLLYAFSSATLGFIFYLIRTIIILLSDFNVASTLFYKLFDVFLMIGALWFFVFLTDFVENLKKYIPLSVAFLIIISPIILILPTRVISGRYYGVELRNPLCSLAILLYWLIHQGVIAYQFAKHARLILEKDVRVKMLLMASGSFCAILAYLIASIEVQNPAGLLILRTIALSLATGAGVNYYLGLQMPRIVQRLLIER